MTYYETNRISIKQSTTEQIFQQLMKLSFQGSGKDYIYDIFSKTNHIFFQYNSISYNHTSATPKTSQKHTTRDWTGLSKGYLIKNKNNIFHNSLWTKYSKGVERNLYMISFQQPITYSTNITLSLRITHQILQQLLNNNLQGTGKDSLKDIFTTNNRIILQNII